MKWKEKTIKVTLFTTLSRKNISDISLYQLTDSWTNIYKSQIYAFPAWKIKNFLKLFSSLATKICFSFLSVVQLSATLDGRKAKLFAVIVVFVQIVTFYRIWMGWFGTISTYILRASQNGKITSSIPDINSIKGLLTVWYILTTGQSPCNDFRAISLWTNQKVSY